MAVTLIRVDPPYETPQEASLFLREMRRHHSLGFLTDEDYARRRKAVAERIHIFDARGREITEETA